MDAQAKQAHKSELQVFAEQCAKFLETTTPAVIGQEAWDVIAGFASIAITVRPQRFPFAGLTDEQLRNLRDAETRGWR